MNLTTILHPNPTTHPHDHATAETAAATQQLQARRRPLPAAKAANRGQAPVQTSIRHVRGRRGAGQPGHTRDRTGKKRPGGAGTNTRDTRAHTITRITGMECCFFPKVVLFFPIRIFLHSCASICIFVHFIVFLKH